MMDAFVYKRSKEDVSYYVSGKHHEDTPPKSSCEKSMEYSAKFINRTECKTEVETKEQKKRKNSVDSSGISLKRTCFDKVLSKQTVDVCPHQWRLINAENLKLKYTRIFTKQTADFVFRKLEEEVKYFSGDLVKVKVFGRWHDIPRKQVSYGDSGLTYAFSGTCVPAVPWNECKIVMKLKELVESVAGHSFNFVLVNRYKDGMDHMGEHRDDEEDLVATAPIASLSLGQQRDFIFKHKDARGNKAQRKIDPVKIELEHGSLLLMEWPTNKFWYHSLPVRKKAVNTRINLTFRQMVIKR